MNPHYIEQSLANGPFPNLSEVGVPAGATGVTVREYADGGIVHRTVFTFTSFANALTLNGTSTAGGGTKIYTFPEGYIKTLGVVSNLTSAAAGDGSFLASLGTAAAGTDGSLSSTEANICASTASTISSGVGTLKMKGDTVAALDGTSSALDLYFNNAINADGTGKATLTYTGTLTVTWMKLGDN